MKIEETLVSAEQSLSIPAKLLSGKRRIEMFIDDYYFGRGIWINVQRMIGGPITIAIGLYLYQGNGKFAAAYGGFCIAYGLYYAMKPLLWIFFRRATFRSIPIEIELTDLTITIKDDGSTSEISYSKFRQIHKRSTYYVLRLPNLLSIYLPHELLNSDQQLILDTKLTR